MIPRGGRGRKTPHPTRPVRVPEPLIDRVYALIVEFHGGGDASSYESPVADSGYPISLESAISQAQAILRSKRGNKQAQFEKLLQVIYGVDTIDLSSNNEDTGNTGK